jgi:hypothetical protein
MGGFEARRYAVSTTVNPVSAREVELLARRSLSVCETSSYAMQRMSTCSLARDLSLAQPRHHVAGWRT